APISILMLIAAALLVRRMRLLEMGDDTACALGVSVERSRLLMMLVAVVLTAAATALAGPISFIALVAPHIARRISGTARWGLTQAALCGALLLLAARSEEHTSELQSRFDLVCRLLLEKKNSI